MIVEIQPREPYGMVNALQPFVCFTNRPQNHRTMAQIFQLSAFEGKKEICYSHILDIFAVFFMALSTLVHISYLFPAIYF